MKKRLLCPLILLGSLGAAAQAHSGVNTASRLVHGFTHPIAGLDHVCAMLAVGLWAAQRRGRALWAVPLSFVGVMLIGWWLGMAGVVLPAVEQGIAASVLVLGLLIAGTVRIPVSAASALVGLFALFHGHAHGAEMPTVASGFAYGAGFVSATVLLHMAGIAFASGVKGLGETSWVRFTGGAIASCGLYLCFLAF